MPFWSNWEKSKDAPRTTVHHIHFFKRQLFQKHQRFKIIYFSKFYYIQNRVYFIWGSIVLHWINLLKFRLTMNVLFEQCRGLVKSAGKGCIIPALVVLQTAMKATLIIIIIINYYFCLNILYGVKWVYLITLIIISLDVVPIAGLEGFRALKFSRLKYFRALKCINRIGWF